MFTHCYTDQRQSLAGSRAVLPCVAVALGFAWIAAVSDGSSLHGMDSQPLSDLTVSAACLPAKPAGAAARTEVFLVDTQRL